MAMRPRHLAVATAALLLTLTGCAAPAENGDSADTAEATSISETTPTPTATDTTPPLVAESPTASAADAAFLEFVRGDLVPNSGIRNATDEQLIAAGHEACEQMAAGTPHDDLRLVEGEQPQPTGLYADSGSILTGALGVYCPELVTPTE